MDDETKISELTEKEIQDKYSGWVMNGVYDENIPANYCDKNVTHNDIRYSADREVTIPVDVERFREMTLGDVKEIAEANANRTLSRRLRVFFSHLYHNNNASTLTNSNELIPAITENYRESYINGDVAVLRRAKKLLMKNPDNSGSHTIMCSADYMERLLSTTEYRSPNYETFRSLVDADLDHKAGFGFKWVIVEMYGYHDSRYRYYNGIAYDKQQARLCYTTPVNTFGFSHSNGHYIFATRWRDRFEMLGDVSNTYRLL